MSIVANYTKPEDLTWPDQWIVKDGYGPVFVVSRSPVKWRHANESVQPCKFSSPADAMDCLRSSIDTIWPVLIARVDYGGFFKPGPSFMIHGDGNVRDVTIDEWGNVV